MFNQVLDINVIVDLIQTLACIAVIVDALEIISERHQYGPNGIYNFAILKTYYRWMMNKWFAPLLNFFCGYPRYIYVVSIQLIAAALIVSHLFTDLSLFLIAIILAIHLLSHLRNSYGLDGSDQMQVIIFSSLFIFYLSSDPLIKEFSIIFLSLQSLLSYFTSGFTKLISPVWRGGMAISGILDTLGHGHKAVAGILIKKPFLSKLICWGVLIFECGLPILVFTGIQATMIFIVVGILFHLSIAILMRLNAFFWTFVATYPAIIFFANAFQKYMDIFSISLQPT